jgi:hypothetical protein
VDYEVGDWTVPTLTVSPFDGTTLATLAVVNPATGIATPLTPTTSDGGNHWTAPTYEFVAAGEWVERWTVTGTGTGKERRVLLVAPDPADMPSGQRVYATTTDYANALHTAPPAGARKALAEASRAVEDMLFTAVYPVDTAGLPTDADHIIALRDATCVQAEDAKAYASRLTGSFTLGRLQVAKRPPAAVSKERYRSPRALQILRDAGLTGHEPWAR